MSIEFFVITVLLLLLVSTQVFWAIQHQKLINKLMSRDFYEYKQGQTYKPLAPATPSIKDAEADPELERQARELNSMFGIV